MRRGIPALMVWVGLMSMTGARAQLADDFSSGSFSTFGWGGDTSHFRFTSSSAIPTAQHPALQLYATGTGISVVYVMQNTSAKMEWGGWCKLSFNPSASNYARIYLAGEAGFPADPEGSIFMGFGMTGDRAGIYTHQGGQIVPLWTDTLHLFNQSTNQLRFRVVYKEAWWFFEADPTGGDNLLPVDSFEHPYSADTLLTALWCQYTSSNATKFYFDDIYAGPLIEDTVSPQLLSAQPKSPLEIELCFSEILHPDLFQNSNAFPSPQLGLPLVVFADPVQRNMIHLIYANPLPDGTWFSLEINTIKDPAGNLMQDTTVLLTWHRALRNEILITEIMADPSPAVKLPETEYLELFNAALSTVTLCDWVLWIDEERITLPCITMKPGEFLLLVNEKDTPYWEGYPQLSGIPKLSLRNDGSLLALQDHEGHIIHAASYASSWHSTTFQAEGGYSLEMKDPDHPCDQAGTWCSSLDISGGTPGKSNSYQSPWPDLKSPSLLRVYVTGSLTVNLMFSEPIDTTRDLLHLFSVENAPGMVVKVIPQPPLYEHVVVQLSEPLKPDTVYSLIQADTMIDCAGNQFFGGKHPFGIPAIPDSLDLVINEVMFKPATCGVEYLELYNNSGKLIDLSACLLARVDDITGVVTDLFPLTMEPSMILPYSYAAITTNSGALLSQHPAALPERVHLNTGMPTLPDGEASFALISQGGKVIDKIHYLDDYHAPSVSDSRGIALERLSPGLSGTNRESWFSASASAGWGSPTLPNTQLWIQNSLQGTVEVSPACFFPYREEPVNLVFIRIFDLPPAALITISLFSEDGFMIRSLASESIAGEKDVYRWEGTDNYGKLLPPGVYIIAVTIWDAVSGYHHVRKTVVMAK